MRHVVTRTVRDSAAVLDVLQGYATGDWYSAPPPARPYTEEVGAQPGKLRIGLRTSPPLGLATTDPECIAAVDETARLLESLGHSVVEAAPDALDETALLETFSTVMLASLRADMIEVESQIGHPVTRDDMEPTTWASLEAGAAIDTGTYLRALTKMQAWARRVIAWWFDGGFDLLLTPTCAEPPPVLGDLTHPETGGSRLLPFVLFTAPFNVTGQPAMSVPLATSASGLPVGVQLVAAPDREDLLIRVAAQLERANPWADRRPPVHA
jgi:amidase